MMERQFKAGISVQFAPESLSSLRRNRCPVSPGMGVQFAPESVSSWARNTHHRTLTDNAIRVGQLLGPLGCRFVSIDERNAARVVGRIRGNDHHNFLGCSVETLEYLDEQDLLTN